MIHFVGLDCHLKTIRACRRAQDGKIASEADLPATKKALEEYAQKHLTREDVIVLEATFHSRAIARILQPFVARVVISNPLQTKAIAQAKKKTDKVDARVLSDLLRAGYLPEVWLPDPGTEKRRDLCARRVALIGDRTRVKNRIHSVLAAALIPVEVSDLFGKNGLQWLQKLALHEDQRLAVESELRLLEAVQREIDALEARIQQDAWDDPRVKLLMSLPGVNVAVAETLLAAIGDVERFQTPEQLAAYLGLVPSVHQSGARCYRGPITPQGSSKARWMLIQAAQHVMAHPGPLGHFARRLLKKKNRNVAVVACARKLAVIAWHMLKNNEPYRYALPQPTQDKLARLRVAVTKTRRQGGTKKGEPRSANYGTGAGVRRVASLPTVYEQEGLPPAKLPSEVPVAERRVLRELGAARFVEEIQHQTSRPRPSKTTEAQQSTPDQASPPPAALPESSAAGGGEAKVTQLPTSERQVSRVVKEREPRGS